jgi:hypothetical protein
MMILYKVDEENISRFNSTWSSLKSCIAQNE